MKMYSEKEVTRIIEEFLAEHFNFDYIGLNNCSIVELKTICENYGVEIEGFESNE